MDGRVASEFQFHGEHFGEQPSQGRQPCSCISWRTSAPCRSSGLCIPGKEGWKESVCVREREFMNLHWISSFSARGLKIMGDIWAQFENVRQNLISDHSTGEYYSGTWVFYRRNGYAGEFNGDQKTWLGSLVALTKSGDEFEHSELF